MLNRYLPQVLELFHQFGWNDAELKDVPHLPIGDSEQQKLVVQGLKSGEWTTYESRSGVVSLIGKADPLKLTLFGLRCGITTKRFLQLMGFTGTPIPHEIVAECVAQRGAAFAQAFISDVARSIESESDTRLFLHAEYNLTSLVLINSEMGKDLPIPEHVNYLRVWAMCACVALHLDVVNVYDSFDWRRKNHKQVNWEYLELETLEPRFSEHLRAALGAQVSLAGPLGHVLIEAWYRDLVTREYAVSAIINAAESATRLGVRRRLVQMCENDLEITDAEMLDNIGSIIGAISTGESCFIQYFGLRLIEIVSEEYLCDIALPGLYCTVLKTQLMVLKALAERPAPAEEIRNVLQPRILELSASDNRHVAHAARMLIAVWGLADNEPGFIEAPSAAEPPQANLWRPTPPLWELERFEVPEVTIAQLGEDLTQLCYSTNERLLAQVIDVAMRYPEEAKSCFGRIGLYQGFLYTLWQWATDTSESWRRWAYAQRPHHGLVGIRDTAVAGMVGEYPCVLSTPSFANYSISIEDFFARLDHFRATGFAVVAPDLMLALLRLDTEECDTYALVEASRRYDSVGVRIAPDLLAQKSVHAVIAEYFSSPVYQRGLRAGQRWLKGELRPQWVAASHPIPPAFIGFGLLDHQSGVPELGAQSIAHPSWDDTAYTEMIWHKHADQGPLNALAAQAARRKKPLTPAIAVNLLACVRPTADTAASTVYESILKAWDRGLLRPGVVDVGYLDWAINDVNFTGLAEPLLELARDGLLSIIWPLFDALLYRASTIENPVPGVSDIAEAMAELAPHVAAALKEENAPRWAAAIPGARAYAAKKGSSRAVLEAKTIVAAIPDAKNTSLDYVNSRVLTVKQVTRAEWETAAHSSTLVDTEADVQVVSARSAASAWFIKRGEQPALWLRSPAASDNGEHLFIRSITDVVNFHIYDAIFASSGKEEKPGAFKEEPWHVSYSDGKWTATRRRKAYGAGGFPLNDVVLAAVLVLATNSDADDAHEFLLYQCSRNGVSSKDIAQIMRRLLPQKEFSPERLFNLVVRNAEFLPFLWPIVTEPIMHAAEPLPSSTILPTWLRGALDAVLHHADAIAAAVDDGYIPEKFWNAVETIATSRAAKTVTKPAKKILKHRQPHHG